jgi:uncharacterized protein (DUF342 family)
MVFLIKLASLLLSVSVSFSVAFADESQKRIEDLEKQIKELKQKVEKMENTLTRSNGFMIVANVTCDINTPFDGSFTATELSETAARQSVTDKCLQKLSDKSRCLPQFVVCKK